MSQTPRGGRDAAVPVTENRSLRPPHWRERSFGLSVGGVLVLVAAVLFWRGRLAGAEILGAIGAALVAFGYLAPAMLKWPSDVWWRFAIILGYVNARVILTLAFVLILTPMGLIWRLIGRDPMTRKRDRWPGWMPHPPRYRSPEHYRKMY